LRILLLTDNYPPETNPSALRCSTHAKRWAERGNRVSVVTSFPNFPEGKLFAGYRQSLFRKEVIDDVNIVRVPTLIFANRGVVRRALDFLSFMITGSLGSLLVERPDAVVATSPQFFTAVAGWLVSRFYRCAFVFEVRDLWPDSIVAVRAMKEGFGIRMIRRVEEFLYRQADSIVVVTHSTRDVLIARGIDPNKLVVITNGIDTAAFKPGVPPSELRQRLGMEGKTVVSYIGTVGMAHGLQLVLDAAAESRSRLPDVQFLIVGTGAELSLLQREAKDRDLANVTFVGRVAHAEIVDYWRLSDVTLVLLRDASLFRTVLPSKVFEAMATGTPIITNVRGELESTLSPAGAAVIIEPGSSTALVNAIGELATDSARRRALSTAGVEMAKRYDRTELADRMLATLMTLKRGATDPGC
jgi:colanic acid biosynthesis glycosyl transferase WcaI